MIDATSYIGLIGLETSLKRLKAVMGEYND
jgi:hypothetical protein